MIRTATKLWAIIGSVALMVPLAVSAQSIHDTDPAAAETLDQGPLATFGARLAYNSDRGALVGARVQTNRLFGSDTLSFGIEASEDTLRYNLFYGAPQVFGDNPVFGVEAFSARSDQSEAYGFDSQVFEVQPSLTWRLGSGARVETYLGLSWAEISNVPATTSQLIRNDAGDRMAQVLGVDFSNRVSGDGGALQGLRYGVTAEYGQTDRDHRYTQLSARVTGGWALGAQDNVLLRARLRSGVLNSLEGTSHIGDRIFLGQSSLRGFAFGGFGPRDLAVADSPALGGNAYAIARFDAQFANLMESDTLLPGVFLDMGSLWGLDSVAGGVAGADPVDDSFGLRGSVGLSLAINTGVGPIMLSWAHPFERESYDRIEEFSLSFQHSF